MDNKTENNSLIISLPLPEYNINTKPDYQAIGTKIDKILEKNFSGKSVAIRALSLNDHPQFTLDEFVKKSWKKERINMIPTERELQVLKIMM